MSRFAAGEYYRITLDDTKPYYRIAGGLQDNENWVGPSGVPSKEGIRNSDWIALAGGDGFYVVFDPADRDVFYAESQGAKCTGSICATASCVGCGRTGGRPTEVPISLELAPDRKPT